MSCFHCEPGHRWFTAFGDHDGATADLDIEITSGGAFDSAEPVPEQHSDGSLKLVFDDCKTGNVTYNIPSINRQGVIPIQRLANDNVALYEVLGDN